MWLTAGQVRALELYRSHWPFDPGITVGDIAKAILVTGMGHLGDLARLQESDKKYALAEGFPIDEYRIKLAELVTANHLPPEHEQTAPDA